MTDHTTPGRLLQTIPAIAGLVFAAAAAVQFLDAEIAIGVFDWSFSPQFALIVSLAALVIVFASSETRDWEYYDNYEQSIVALSVIIMVTHQYTELVSTAIGNNQPYAGAIAFAIGMVAWGVLAR